MLQPLLLLLLFVLIVDLYALRGVRIVANRIRMPLSRRTSALIFWGEDIFFLLFSGLWIAYLSVANLPDYVIYRKFFVIAGLFTVIYLPRMVFGLFLLLDDARFLLLKAIVMLPGLSPKTVHRIRLAGRNRLITFLGLFAAVAVFVMNLHGIFIGKYNFTVVKHEMAFKNLPDAFDGYRLVHFSDTHLGSFRNEKAIRKGLEIIKKQQADLIVFTGDLINNHADEARAYVPIFQQLKAQDGLFSVLGNHDIGDYRSWGTIEKKEPDIDALLKLQQDMGFRLLLDEHVKIFRGNDSIMLAGVNNWGLPPFTQHGDLQKAIENGATSLFTILLSHDPSHWQAIVVPESNVDLTLSGHTHGMQIGIVNRWFAWSPVQAKYKEWHGIYRNEGQALYVNRGFGFLSFPGRIGMPPEITVITLRKKLP